MIHIYFELIFGNAFENVKIMSFDFMTVLYKNDCPWKSVLLEKIK